MLLDDRANGDLIADVSVLRQSVPGDGQSSRHHQHDPRHLPIWTNDVESRAAQSSGSPHQAHQNQQAGRQRQVLTRTDRFDLEHPRGRKLIRHIQPHAVPACQHVGDWNQLGLVRRIDHFGQAVLHPQEQDPMVEVTGRVRCADVQDDGRLSGHQIGS